MKTYVQPLVAIILALFAGAMAYGMMKSDVNRVTKDQVEITLLLREVRESNIRLVQKLDDLTEQVRRNTNALEHKP